MGEWIGEENIRIGIMFKVYAKKILYESSSKFFEKIIVGDSEAFGKFLVLKENSDSTFQVAEKWDIYSEMLVHVPLSAHPSPKHILIVGGGDGSTLREVVKHDEVEKIILVDIDEKIVEAGKKYLKIDDGAFSDDRLVIINEDALKFLKHYDGKSFDIVIGDYTDPYIETPASTLIRKEFYRLLKDNLSSDGIIALQAGSPILQQDIMLQVYNGVKKLFKHTYIYTSPIPYYPSGYWSYVIASDQYDPRKPVKKIKNTFYYNEEIHQAAFILPNFIKRMIQR